MAKSSILTPLIGYLKLSVNGFEKAIKVGESTISKAIKRGSEISPEIIEKILDAYPIVSEHWLETGHGAMLIVGGNPGRRNLLPFYDDKITIGGVGEVADMDPVYGPSGYIDAGTMFPGATGYVRHYGDSMSPAYESGDVLAIKKIRDKRILIWGADYMVETAEIRVTKRMQKGQEKGMVRLCSVNEETYKNGVKIHDDMDVYIDDIRAMHLVMGKAAKYHSMPSTIIAA